MTSLLLKESTDTRACTRTAPRQRGAAAYKHTQGAAQRRTLRDLAAGCQRGAGGRPAARLGTKRQQVEGARALPHCVPGKRIGACAHASKVQPAVGRQFRRGASARRGGTLVAQQGSGRAALCSARLTLGAAKATRV